jgi:hypothetical protein
MLPTFTSVPIWSAAAVPHSLLPPHSIFRPRFMFYRIRTNGIGPKEHADMRMGLPVGVPEALPEPL